MAYVRIIDQSEARGSVRDDYAFIAQSYSNAFGSPVPAPQVYRSSSLVPAYFNFGAVQNRVLTNDGRHDRPVGAVPPILMNFATSLYSSCFY